MTAFTRHQKLDFVLLWPDQYRSQKNPNLHEKKSFSVGNNLKIISIFEISPPNIVVIRRKGNLAKLKPFYPCSMV